MQRIKIISCIFCLILILTLSQTIACGLTPNFYNAADAGTTLTDNANLVDTERAVQPTTVQSPLLPAIADVVAAVKPSVVAIDTEVSYNLFSRSFTQQGAGSGWIIDDTGIIVTNYHVIAEADSIWVTLDDGRSFSVDPDSVVSNPRNDLAVFRIEARDLPSVTIGDSSALMVGDWLVSIGNSLGLGISAKEGIASRLNVSLSVDGQIIDNLVETSAAINPGNSGGPLVNMRGEVIGITSVKIASVGVEGLGYAIGINSALPIINNLIAALPQPGLS